jgi:hypothetical protein
MADVRYPLNELWLDILAMPPTWFYTGFDSCFVKLI